MNLASGDTVSFPGIRRFSFNSEKPTWVVMQGGAAGPAGPAAPAGGRGGPPGGGGGGGAQTGGNADILLYNLVTREPVTNIGRISQYAFNDNGDLLAYTMENPDQLGNAVQVRDMKTGAVKALETDAVLYRHLGWVDSSRSVAVMRGKVQTTGARDTLFSLRVFRGVTANGATRTMTFTPESRGDFPTGMKLASERAPRYSNDMTMVFFGIRDGLKPGPRALNSPLVTQGAPGFGGTINQTAAGRGNSGNAALDSVPSLILWHLKDSRMQSQQIVQEAADRAFNYLVEYRFDTDKFIRLSDDSLRSVTVTANDRFAYGTDNRAYQQFSSTSGRYYQDIYVIDLNTGARKMLLKKRPGTAFGAISPDGKKALRWGIDGHYWVLDLATLDSVNITKAVPTSFVNTEWDYASFYPIPLPARGWSKDGASVLLYDNWDIWKVSSTATAAAVNLTGDGRKTQTRYNKSYAWNTDAEDDDAADGGGSSGAVFDLTKPMYFGTYGEWTKKESIAKVEPGQPGAKMLMSEDALFNITKARNADTYIYTRQTFTDFPNYYVFNPGFQSGYQITNVNPQIKDLAWSSGTRLIDYKSAKGDKLQGALYLPANYEPGKKYPLLVMIYEKQSQQKNGFVHPSETYAASPTMYTSRGYAVLKPDIVYRMNDPGMSAVWCVVPAVQAAIASGIVDPAKVGLWGHSWGGYQTAFLVTQTNIFKAAVAGAALTDMVSMYNSVHWFSGLSNQAIFATSQARFTGNVAENTEAYIRNSPVFHAHKVQTPLMLLHNDKDGSVDFNQGITYFNALRQLGKDVIMLSYVGEDHNLVRPVNQRDYATRMAEWFDHYLVGKPAPEWMKNGIPRLQMADHLASRKDTSGTGGRVIVP
jgi:dipeptidyl aminopeptidase/acylaminoacyl peptidase